MNRTQLVFPRLMTCEDCIEAVANVICHDELNVDIKSVKVNRDHYMKRADHLLIPLLERARYADARRSDG